MTTGPDHELRRATDTAGFWGKARAWWRLNGGFVMAPVLLVTSVVLIVVAFQVRHLTVDASRAAKLQCERSMLLGPYLAADYERRDVFPPGMEPLIRSTLPKSCPK